MARQPEDGYTYEIPTLGATVPAATAGRAAVRHLEEVASADQPIDVQAILTDDQLERGGLVKVEAFIRTKTSAAAARKAAQRERDTDAGLRQVNIKTTEETGSALKSIAAEVGRGATLVDAICSTWVGRSRRRKSGPTWWRRRQIGSNRGRLGTWNSP